MKTVTKTTTRFLLTLPFGLIGLAPLAIAEPVVGGSTSESARALDLALESIRADFISADLHFIAADELGGRDSPSKGQRIAARFIRNRLQRLGWQPGAGDSYFHTNPNRNADTITHANRIPYADAGSIAYPHADRITYSDPPSQ